MFWYKNSKSCLLRGLDTLGRFSAIFTRKLTFVTSCLLSYTPSPVWKGVFSKGKCLLPLGADSFLLSRRLFRKEVKPFWQLLPLKVYPFPLNVLLYYYKFSAVHEFSVLKPQNWHFYNTLQWTLITTTAFVPKDVAIKMNLLLYRILNEQIDMSERFCYVLISS